MLIHQAVRGRFALVAIHDNLHNAGFVTVACLSSIAQSQQGRSHQERPSVAEEHECVKLLGNQLEHLGQP